MHTPSYALWALCSTLALASPHPYGSNFQRRQSLNQTLGIPAGTPGLNQTFDYVIVGAGTAGLPLAYRLSEDPTKQVALIEGEPWKQIVCATRADNV